LATQQCTRGVTISYTTAEIVLEAGSMNAAVEQNLASSSTALEIHPKLKNGKKNIWCGMACAESRHEHNRKCLADN